MESVFYRWTADTGNHWGSGKQKHKDFLAKDHFSLFLYYSTVEYCTVDRLGSKIVSKMFLWRGKIERDPDKASKAESCPKPGRSYFTDPM